MPDAVIAAIENSQQRSDLDRMASPRDGIVLERNAIEGMRAQPGDVLFRIADHSVVWALIDVAERDLGAIADRPAGRPCGRAAFPGAISPGRSSVIYPEINKETRTARVRIELPNPDLSCCPTCMPTPKSTPAAATPVLTVPESAVIDTGSRQVVLLDKGEGRFEPREVKIGHRGDGYVEIRERRRRGRAASWSRRTS